MMALAVFLWLMLLSPMQMGTSLPSQFDSKLYNRDELVQLDWLRSLRLASSDAQDNAAIEWIANGATDVDLLRFIRHHGGTSDRDGLFASIRRHVAWRRGPLGVDTVSSEENVASNAWAYDQLSKEVFWLGVSKTGCPTLVIRTQMHDGKMYNEDANLFTSYMVYMLELGRRRYGAGSERKVCLLMDRSKVTLPSGEVKKEVLDFAILPRLVELFTTLYRNLYPNFPDILAGAQVAPSSWFFSMCYRVTSQVMDAVTRSKFEMIASGDVASIMAEQFSQESLPPHLGGVSESYGDDAAFSAEALEAAREEMSRSSGSNKVEIEVEVKTAAQPSAVPPGVQMEHLQQQQQKQQPQQQEKMTSEAAAHLPNSSTALPLPQAPTGASAGSTAAASGGSAGAGSSSSERPLYVQTLLEAWY